MAVTFDKGSIDKAEIEDKEHQETQCIIMKNNEILTNLIHVDGEFNQKNICYFKIYLTTGDQTDAGTNASISIAFVGESCVTNFYSLKRRGMPITFSRGSTEKFILKTPILNNIKYVIVKLTPNSSQPINWFMKSLRVENIVTHSYWYSELSYWFSPNRDDKKTCRVIPVIPSTYELIDYIISMKIMKSDNKQIQHNLYIKCFGTTGNSDKISLTNKHLNKNKKYFKFEIKMKNIGDVKKIRIGVLPQLGSIQKPSNSCNSLIVQKIAIQTADKQETIFSASNYASLNITQSNCSKYIEIVSARFKPSQATPNQNIPPIFPSENITYDISIWNCDSKYLSNLSTVFVQLLGQVGRWSDIYQISDIRRHSGENVDKYRVFGENLGPLKKIMIWHKAGVASGWHLDKVKVIRYMSTREILVTVSVLKRQGKLPHGVSIENDKIVLNSNFHPTEAFNIPKKASIIFKYINTNGYQVVNQAGDVDNNNITTSTTTTAATTTTNKDIQLKSNNNEDLNHFETFCLPYAEEFTFLCQTWLSIDEGDETIKKIVPLCERKFLHSPVKLIFSKKKHLND